MENELPAKFSVSVLAEVLSAGCQCQGTGSFGGSGHFEKGVMKNRRMEIGLPAEGDFSLTG
jgi:hypothetical protein